MEIKNMPSQNLLEEYLAGAFGRRSVIFDPEEGMFKRTEERPFFHPEGTDPQHFQKRMGLDNFRANFL